MSSLYRLTDGRVAPRLLFRPSRRAPPDRDSSLVIVSFPSRGAVLEVAQVSPCFRRAANVDGMAPACRILLLLAAAHSLFGLVSAKQAYLTRCLPLFSPTYVVMANGMCLTSFLPPVRPSSELSEVAIATRAFVALCPACILGEHDVINRGHS